MMARGVCAMIAVAVAWPAFAQEGPSFDCTKASTRVEREICKSAELMKADRAMAAAYLALLGKLSGPAKEHLIKDQVSWIGNRARACSEGFLEAPQCLKLRFEDRTARLRMLGEPATYPFVSEQAIVRKGKVGTIDFNIDASYPQFDGGTADFSPTNAEFAANTNNRAADVIPKTDSVATAATHWFFSQSFNLYRPSPVAVGVETSFYGFTGGAHGYAETHGTLVDLRSGRIVQVPTVFSPSADWLGTVGEIVRTDLKKQFVKRPGYDDALLPDKIAKLLREYSRYVFKRDVLTVVFNQYEVAAYAFGPYFVDIPYSRLRPLLRVDGPLDGS